MRYCVTVVLLTLVISCSKSPPSLTLSWVDNPPPVQGINEPRFQVERRLGGDDPGAMYIWHVVVTLPSNATQYTDTGLRHNTKYCYRVRAISLLPGVGPSKYTDEVCMTTK